MKTRSFFFCLLLGATWFLAPSLNSADEKFAGIVYGPKAAFNIKTPEDAPALKDVSKSFAYLAR